MKKEFFLAGVLMFSPLGALSQNAPLQAAPQAQTRIQFGTLTDEKPVMIVSHSGDTAYINARKDGNTLRLGLFLKNENADTGTLALYTADVSGQPVVNFQIDKAGQDIKLLVNGKPVDRGVIVIEGAGFKEAQNTIEKHTGASMRAPAPPSQQHKNRPAPSAPRVWMA